MIKCLFSKLPLWFFPLIDFLILQLSIDYWLYFLFLFIFMYLISYTILIFFLGNSYRDILHCNKKPFYLKGREEDSSIMDAYIIHSVRAIT